MRWVFFGGIALAAILYWFTDLSPKAHACKDKGGAYVALNGGCVVIDIKVIP